MVKRVMAAFKKHYRTKFKDDSLFNVGSDLPDSGSSSRAASSRMEDHKAMFKGRRRDVKRALRSRLDRDEFGIRKRKQEELMLKRRKIDEEDRVIQAFKGFL